MMKNLEFLKEWDLLLQKIAEMLNVSLSAVQENASVYLHEFGRYQLMYNILRGIALMSILGSIVAFTIICIISIANAFDDLDDFIEAGKENKILFVLPVVGFSILPLYGVIYHLFLYWASPNIYAIKELLKLLK